MSWRLESACRVSPAMRDGWSPQQIAGRIRREGHPEGYVSHETIYRHVYSPRGREEGLYALLAAARRQRRRRFGRKPRATPIPPERSIALRPERIATREEFGRWEGDLVIFARRPGGANATSLQERQGRFVMLIDNEDKRSSTVATGIDAKFTPLPANACRSITLDRGTEFLRYPTLPTQAWFCDPHSPWQKGGIENANGRLRRFLPLDSAPGDRTPVALAALAQKLNTTPLPPISQPRPRCAPRRYRTSA